MTYEDPQSGRERNLGQDTSNPAGSVIAGIIFLAALATTFGMPLVIEIGVFFDLLMGILIMGVFAFRIRDTFEHLDVTKLRRLRG